MAFPTTAYTSDGAAFAGLVSRSAAAGYQLTGGLTQGGMLAAVVANMLEATPPDAITVGDIVLATGSVIVGAAGVGSAVDAKTSGQILVGSGTTVASVAVSGDITLTSAGVTAIGAGKVAQAMDAPNTRDATVVASNAADNVIGSIPVVFQVAIAAGAVGAKNITMTHKVRVIDAYVVLRGAGVASCTLTVGNAGNAITDALDVSGADTAIVRAAQINDANYEIAAAGSLRVTTAAGASQPDCTVYVTAVRVA